MPWHPVASGMCDRNVNAADGVGSWKHEPRTHPVHADGRLVYNGADRDAKMEIPAIRSCSWTGLACVTNSSMAGLRMSVDSSVVPSVRALSVKLNQRYSRHGCGERK